MKSEFESDAIRPSVASFPFYFLFLLRGKFNIFLSENFHPEDRLTGFLFPGRRFQAVDGLFDGLFGSQISYQFCFGFRIRGRPRPTEVTVTDCSPDHPGHFFIFANSLECFLHIFIVAFPLSPEAEGRSEIDLTLKCLGHLVGPFSDSHLPGSARGGPREGSTRGVHARGPQAYM